VHRRDARDATANAAGAGIEKSQKRIPAGLDDSAETVKDTGRFAGSPWAARGFGETPGGAPADEARRTGGALAGERVWEGTRLQQLNRWMSQPWSVVKSDELYGISKWGHGYFGVNEAGNVVVHPTRDANVAIDLKQLVDEIRERGIHPPILLRFSDILRHRIQEIHDAFRDAIANFQYRNVYRCVYPIKVNQQRHVVQEIVENSRPYGFGLEAGSKPELFIALALIDDNHTPLVCNGYKDAEFIEAVVLAQKIGRNILPVIERFGELELLIELGKRHGVRPAMGVRLKLASRGAGRWESSSGSGSKFGLTIHEILQGLERLKSEGLADCLRLVHFHMGSQITNIRSIHEAVKEATRIFVELHRAGAGVDSIDVGGGLGIDYDGSRTNFGSSMNYDLGEYARDVVFGVQSICDEAGVPHPVIYSESGRALASPHSVLVTEVIDVHETSPPPVPSREEALAAAEDGDVPSCILHLYDSRAELSDKNLVEVLHDAVTYRDEAMHLFKLGYLTLRQRDLAERLFWSIATEVYRRSQLLDYAPDELHELETLLSDTYVCNYSVFQSIPDNWACGQLFPIAPIHRLNEYPDRRATLADITCDSDGKVDRFVDQRDVKKVLELHRYTGEPYYLGTFLVGAYQEILGDLHNLFGDTHAVHVHLDGDGRPAIETVVKGDTVREVLSYVQFSAEELAAMFRKGVERAGRDGKISVSELGQLLHFYESGLEGYTYLE
jgi:arginine decarboxylase